jgi:hypothetical protein
LPESRELLHKYGAAFIPDRLALAGLSQPYKERTMQKSMQVMMGVAALGACFFFAPSVHAKHIPGHVEASGSTMVDEDCVARHNADIKKCGKNKKCVAKHKKLKNKCSTVYKPAEKPAVLPYYPSPAPSAMPAPMPPRPMMHDNMGQRPMPLRAPESEVLERIEPQPTGKATGVKTLPDNTYMPPWLRF